MTLVNIVAYASDGTTPLVNLSTASGVRLRSIGRPAVRYRVKTVEFDDVPDETTVSVKKRALYHIKTAKRPATRARRIEEIAARAARGDPPV